MKNNLSQESPFAENRSIFTFWKSRVGLYLILKALGVGPDDEVILPGYTCVVVANAVLYLGARPVYADIDPATFTISLATIQPLVTSRTRVIIAQNTFGLSPDYDPIMSSAEQAGIFVIEDCAHGLGSTYKGRTAGTSTHAAFFSTQWSKPISTGLGGILLVRDAALADKISALKSAVPAPSMLEQIILLAQVISHPLIGHQSLYYLLVDLYRLLTQKVGLSVGSSLPGELTTTNMPPGYLKSMGIFQEAGWKHGLKTIQENIFQRRQIAQGYDAFFHANNIPVPYQPDYASHGMLRYVMRVGNKPELLEKARLEHIPLGDWFISPLHPVTTGLEKWFYRPGQCPEAEKACRETVNLFTDKALNLTQLETLFAAKQKVWSGLARTSAVDE